jgi:hypothetical protein
MNENIEKKLEDFCDLCRQYGNLFTDNGPEGNKVANRIQSICKMLVNSQDGIAGLLKLSKSKNAFISGWSCTTLYSNGNLPDDSKSVIVEKLKSLASKKNEPFSMFMKAFLDVKNIS